MKTPSSPKINRIRIPISNYEIFHSPNKENNPDSKFIGREKQIRDFVGVLTNSKSNKGKYLISGARGVGKTSFIGKVISTLKDEKSKKYLHLPITFNEELNNERDVLTQIVKQLHTEVSKIVLKKHAIQIRIIPVLIFLSCLFIFIYKTDINKILAQLLSEFPITYTNFYIGVFLLGVFCLSWIILQIKRTKSVRFLQEIEAVKTSLNSQKTKENGVSFKGSVFNIRHSTKINTDVLSVKDIENKLIKWSEDISKKVLYRKGMQLIISFDELDKLDLLNNESNLNGVVELFSKIRIFLTDTHAKFIFISGIDMHQRYLDTYSDRSNLLISIIDREEQINSFLFRGVIEGLDTNKATHLFPAIEHYVCSNLFPNTKNLIELASKITNKKDKAQIIHALYHFINYLYFVSNGNPKKMMIHFEKQVVFQDFKRMSQKEINDDQLRYITVEWKNDKVKEIHSECYFELSYSDQLKNSFINYLTSPINFSIIKDKQQYSDGLLVNSSFLLNYIFKYYKNSFSLRNREQFPEIFQSGNSTDTRELVEQMIHFLSKSHIKPILSSVFRYKLPIKITEEIKNITRLSEDTTAIFSFTNAEFTAIKDYCNEQIAELKNDDWNTISDPLLASYHHILGDSHLFADDINDAIISFRNSTMLLHRFIDHHLKEKERVPYTNFTELIRVQLKLGLAYEKRETYATAQGLYSSLASRINEYLYIDLEKLGLKLIETDQYQDDGTRKLILAKENNAPLNMDLMEFLLASNYKKHQVYIEKLNYTESVRMITQPLLAKLFIREKMTNSEIKLSHINQTINDFTQIFFMYETKERFILPADFYKRLGDILFYKNNLSNRVLNNWKNVLYFYDLKGKMELKNSSNINENGKKIEHKDCSIETEQIPEELTELNSMIGKMFNFKNELITENGKIKTNNKSVLLKRIAINTSKCVERRNNIGQNNNLGIEGPVHKMSPSCYACKFYSRSLRYMLRSFSHISFEEIKSSSKTNLIFEYLSKGRFNLRSSNYLETMATTLSSLGDTLLACNQSKYNRKKDDAFFKKFIELLQDKSSGYKKFGGRHSAKIGNAYHKVILYYYLAGRFYVKAGKHSEYMFQLKKIIILLSEGVFENGKKVVIEDQSLHFTCCIEILKKIEKCLLSIYGHSSILENKKITELYSSFQPLEHLNECEKTKSCFKYSSVYADIEDAVYFIKEAFIGFEEIKNNKLLNCYYDRDEQPLTTIYNRMLRLRLNSALHKEKIKSYIDFKNGNCFQNFELSEFIKQFKKGILFDIIDSIFSLKKFTDFVSRQSNTKLFTNTIIAQVYYDLACWLELLSKIFTEFEKGKINDIHLLHEVYPEVKNRLNLIVGIKEITSEDFGYYYGKAIHSYYKALEIHSQGQAYQKMIGKMHLLNDDLNDDLFHFFIALERFRMNTGRMNYLYRNAKRRNGESNCSNPKG